MQAIPVDYEAHLGGLSEDYVTVSLLALGHASVVLVVQLVSQRHALVSLTDCWWWFDSPLKTVDQPKGNGLGQKIALRNASDM